MPPPRPSPSRRAIRDARPPWALAAQLRAPGVCALDAAGPGGWGTPPGGAGPGTSLLACDPEVVFAGGLGALEDARRWLGEWRGEAHGAVLIGYLAYELGSAFEQLPASNKAEAPDAIPPVCLLGYRAVYRYRGPHCGEVVGSDAQAVRHLAERLAQTGARKARPRRELPAARARSSDDQYRAGVLRVKNWIRAGDVYQVNLARRLDHAPVDPALLPDLYACLTRASGAPFSSWLDTPPITVLSNSPERFLRVEGRAVETCPIKGTRPRGRTALEDRQLAAALVASAKDRAEHLMIVDLERSDLGRVSRTGSVRVPRLLELRSYANVHHLVSSVRAELREPDDWTALLAATFPGGSITGAPKLRAMEIIDALEPVRRGVYTGAIGCFDAAGGIDLAIAIRTAVARERSLHLHLGGGIVADSDPDEELRETRHKGSAFARLGLA